VADDGFPVDQCRSNRDAGSAVSGLVDDDFLNLATTMSPAGLVK
jgi:hypothetical protein